jgi:CHASE3 domain sensor protein
MTSKNQTSHVSVRNMLGGSIAALTILVGITVFGFLKQGQVKETSDWVVHTQIVISEFQALESHVHEAVTAQRGYVITQHQNTKLCSWKDMNRSIKYFTA